MLLSSCNLENNSKIVLNINEENKIEIYLKGNELEYLIKKLYTIPSDKIHFIEEISEKNNNLTRLIFSYFDKEKSKYILTNLKIDLEKKILLETKQIESVLKPFIIHSGVYCYRDLKGRKTLITPYGETLQLEKIKIPFWGEISIEATNITFSYLSEDIDNLIEMEIHFEPEETIHTILKFSNEPHKCFQISNHIWSEMTNQEYTLWVANKSSEYASYDIFKHHFENCELAREIAEINYRRLTQIYDQKKKIKSKINSHIHNSK